MEEPTCWKRCSFANRVLVCVTISAVLIVIGLAIALGIITSKKVCLTKECIHTASTILEYMDESVSPCDNFYRFACGNFLKNAVIPDDRSTLSSFTTIEVKLQEQLKNSLEEEYKANDPKHLKLAKTLYQTCMNKALIEAQGLEPLQNRLEELGGWPVLEGNQWDEDEFTWKESVYRFRKAGESVDYFLDFSVSIDAKNNTKYVIELDQAALGLQWEYLSKGFNDRIVGAYYSYMIDIATLLGSDREQAAAELKESLEFEIKLANISLSDEKRRNASEQYNPMSVCELMQRYPSIPWMEYCNTLLAPNSNIAEGEIVIVDVPSFISDLERLLEETPKRVQANYVMWRVVADSVRYLTEELRKRQLTYYAILTGTPSQEPRWRECMIDVSNNLPLSVGALYVKKYFNEDSKKKAVEIVSDIKEEFMKILKRVDWMDDATRSAALSKVTSMNTFAAYPDELLDDDKLDEFYEELEITPGSYFESMHNMSLFQIDHAFSQLRKRFKRRNWLNQNMVIAVNAFYADMENSIKIPAGILQGIFFNNERPKYMNFGTIGYVIGHEITHGFDDHGRQFDKDGNLLEWWAPETEEKYLKKAECIICQYGNYTEPEVNLNLNGINTLGENIADNGGMKEAYLAYNEWVRRNGPEPQLPGLKYNGQQMFWISAARTWCTKYRPEALRMQIITNAHSPAEFRVLGPVSNMPEFARDFNCPAGSPMNPVNKCMIW